MNQIKKIRKNISDNVAHSIYLQYVRHSLTKLTTVAVMTMTVLAQSLIAEAQAALKHARDEERSAPHILSVAFDGVRGEVLRNALEGEGILVSTGSACGSHKQKVSASLLAMGIKPERADGTIRVSLGQFNTLEEMDIAAEEMLRIYKSLRRFQRR